MIHDEVCNKLFYLGRNYYRYLRAAEPSNLASCQHG